MNPVDDLLDALLDGLPDLDGAEEPVPAVPPVGGGVAVACSLLLAVG